MAISTVDTDLEYVFTILLLYYIIKFRSISVGTKYCGFLSPIATH